MIADHTGNDQNGFGVSKGASLLGSLSKKGLSILPESAPSKIYNAARNIPIARDILGAIVRHMVPEKIESVGGTMYLDNTDMAVSGALALGKFELFETEVFSKAIGPGMNIVDIGAHIGYYTLIAAKRSGPTGKVFAFEPEPRNFSLLSKNVSANKNDTVTVINTALSDSSGTRDLFLEKYNKGHHSFATNDHATETIKVKTLTLDEALKQFGSPKIDVLKIDIEGAEPIVLRGMKETIARSPNIIIFTEVYPRSMAKLGESALTYLVDLSSLGFSLSHMDEKTSSLVPIVDISSFVKSFPRGESFRNIYGTKNSQTGHI